MKKFAMMVLVIITVIGMLPAKEAQAKVEIDRVYARDVEKVERLTDLFEQGMAHMEEVDYIQLVSHRWDIAKDGESYVWTMTGYNRELNTYETHRTPIDFDELDELYDRLYEVVYPN